MSSNKEQPLDSGEQEVHSKPILRGQSPTNPQRYHGSKAWWSVGELLHQGITHQSVGLTLGQTDDATWDVSDSLADLYEAVTQRKKQAVNRARALHSRKGSAGTTSRVDREKRLDIQRWLEDDTSHGFIRVFASDSDTQSRLFPCTLSTHAQKICLLLGIPGNALHVQLSGHVIKRMEPFDCPLAIQNEYLAGLGYSDIRYIQQEGPNEDLTYLVRFYSGKPLSDYTYARNQLSTYAYVRKGKLLHQWARRRCVISGTTLLIHRDKNSEPTSVQLAKGSVEEVQVKGQSLVIKLTSTIDGERSIFLSFASQDDYSKWLKRLKKATAKLPSKADLSNCHLEFLPETVFINTELQILTLRHNALRERPLEEDIYTIGWLDDLPRFNMLHSLNLADNQLNLFPLSLCSIRSLKELNLASNKLMEIPSQICELSNLHVLHLHNNLLSSLPEEIISMSNLAVIVLAFNRFVSVPSILVQPLSRSSKLDSIIMAGNQISRLPGDQLIHMGHIKKIDLRLNKLQLLPTETAKFQSLEHVTHLDIRENEVLDLDIRAIRYLEYINCERNNMRTMQINGSSIKNIFASRNRLQALSISPKPEWLISMDVSHNQLTQLPEWLSDCFFLVHLDVSHNQLKALPERLFRDAPKLKIVKANHNRLTNLSQQVRSENLEELHLHHNQLRHLPSELFIKAKRLRYLNVTRNKLCDLPPPNENDSYNKLQELYLSFNHLGNSALRKICCFPRLRVLHLARNKLSVIAETDIERLEQLTEINISSNNLTYLPSSLGRHPKLQILKTNCNLLQELPNFKNSSALKVLEVSSNLLVNVNMANLMASQVSLLDISANPNILVKSQELQAARNSKQLCMVDMRGQNRSLEDLRKDNDEALRGLWQTGLSQTSGMRNKLCVSTLSKPHFNEKGEALFGIFDGGRNDTVAETLCDIMPTVLKEERVRSKKPEVYLKYCMLSAHRNLKIHGQKLGAASVLAFIHVDDKGQNVLSVANVGDAQVVLCRQRKAVVLSRSFVASEDKEDTARVISAGGIITEDGRVSGVTYNTRVLGSSYLYPCVIPDPHVSSTVLTHDDSFFILGSQGLWQYVSHEEAVREIKDVADPVIAAKRLQDLAQGFGSRENMAVLVVRLTLSQDEQSRMSDLIKHQKSAQKELLKILSQESKLLPHLRDGVPKDAKIDDIVFDKSGHVKKLRSSRKRLSEASSSEKSISNKEAHFDSTHEVHRREALKELQKATFNYSPNETSNSEYESTLEKDTEWKDKHLYRKKTDAVTELQKRIAKDLKSNELRNMFERELKSNDANDVDSDDDDIFTVENDTDFNWAAVRMNKLKKENPEQWQSQLHQRITQELVDKELKKTFEETPNPEYVPENEEDENNWRTIPNENGFNNISMIKTHGAVTTLPNKPKGMALPPQMSNSRFNGKNAKMSFNPSNPDFVPSSESKISLHSDTLEMMYNSSHSNLMEPNEQLSSEYAGYSDHLEDVQGYDLSPGESVSSIDLRLHEEADEIYRLRHIQNFEFNSHSSGVLPQLAANIDRSTIARPASPDSLVSLDEFVKPPISNINIDRDALLFHQMQMARAQAHAGSNTSLDTVQSAPLHPRSNELQPNIRASSHSIEVLVNIGLDNKDVQPGSLPRSLHHIKLDFDNGSTSTLTSNEDLSGSQSDGMRGSTESVKEKKSDLKRSDSVENLNQGVDDLKIENNDKGRVFSHIDNTDDRNGEDMEEDDDDNDDRDTLVGDADYLANDLDSGDVANGDTDSDSDESLGNVSLEDGYTAFDFRQREKNSSLSMINVMDVDEDIYPKVSVNGPVANEDISVSSAKQDTKKRKDNDYDDINDDDELTGKKDENYEDDINPYEDYYVKSEEKHTSGSVINRKTLPSEIDDDVDNDDEEKLSPQLNIATEVNIDNLYARVNKIKMKKILDDEQEEDGSTGPIDAFLPSIASIPYPATISTNSIPHNPTGIVFDDEEDYYADDNDDEKEDEEKEIFITATDLFDHQPQQNKPTNNSLATYRPDPNPLILSSSNSKNSPPATLSPTLPSKLKSKPAPFPPLKHYQPPTSISDKGQKSPSPTSLFMPMSPAFKPPNSPFKSPTSPSNGHEIHHKMTKLYLNNKSNHQDVHETNKPSLPSRKPSKPPPPRPVNNPSPPPRPPIPPRHPMSQSDQSSDPPKPLTPVSPKPALSPTANQTTASKGGTSSMYQRANIPTPINMQPASRQLPTQRSVIITYL